jgi:hypothetical protein
VAAAAVATVAKAPGARAADGDPVLFGSVNQGASTTFVLINSNSNNTALSVGANNSGVGLFASSPGGTAVSANGGANGVQGVSSNAGASGVYGQNDAGGFGVAGRSNQSGGIGVLGEGLFGYGVKAIGTVAALDVHGPAVFDRSGVATVVANTKSVTVGPIAIGPNSMVLATVQRAAGGAFVKSAVPNPFTNEITITLDKARTINVPVAWFVIS